MQGSVVGPRHRSVVSRPALVKDNACCCPPVPAVLPDSTTLRGSASGSIRLCGGSFCRGREEGCEGQGQDGVMSPGPKEVGRPSSPHQQVAPWPASHPAPLGASFSGCVPEVAMPLEVQMDPSEGLDLT